MVTEGKSHRGWSEILEELKASNLSCQAQIILLYLVSRFRASSVSVDDIIAELEKAGYMHQVIGGDHDSQRYAVYLSPQDKYAGKH